jgi:hypothetical protein
MHESAIKRGRGRDAWSRSKRFFITTTVALILVLPLFLAMWYGVSLSNWNFSKFLVIGETIVLTYVFASAYRAVLPTMTFWGTLVIFLLAHSLLWVALFGRFSSFSFWFVIVLTFTEFSLLVLAGAVLESMRAKRSGPK